MPGIARLSNIQRQSPNSFPSPALEDWECETQNRVGPAVWQLISGLPLKK